MEVSNEEIHFNKIEEPTNNKIEESTNNKIEEPTNNKTEESTNNTIKELMNNDKCLLDLFKTANLLEEAEKFSDKELDLLEKIKKLAYKNCEMEKLLFKKEVDILRLKETRPDNQEQKNCDEIENKISNTNKRDIECEDEYSKKKQKIEENNNNNCNENNNNQSTPNGYPKLGDSFGNQNTPNAFTNNVFNGDLTNNVFNGDLANNVFNGGLTNNVFNGGLTNNLFNGQNTNFKFIVPSNQSNNIKMKFCGSSEIQLPDSLYFLIFSPYLAYLMQIQLQNYFST